MGSGFSDIERGVPERPDAGNESRQSLIPVPTPFAYPPTMPRTRSRIARRVAI